MQSIFISVLTLTLLFSPLVFAQGGNSLGKKGSSTMQKSGSQFQNKNQNQYKYRYKNQGQSQQKQYQQKTRDKNYYDYGISEKKGGN